MTHQVDTMSIRKAYWVCQGIGWTLFFISGVTMTSIIIGEFEISTLFNHAIATFILFLISHYSRYWFKKQKVFEKKLYKIILAKIGFIFFATTLGVTVVIGLINLIDEPPALPTLSTLYMNFINIGITYAVWISLYAGFKIFMNYRNNEVEKWKLEAKLLETEISALKAQINPHFVFNALNNIRSLISECPEKARKALTTLSKLLRISLRFEEELVIPLRKELQIVKEYLHLESLHLEERLKIFWSLESQIKPYHIPALGIQTLVENAIKHGISVKPDGGIIKIVTKEENQMLKISVFNTGQFVEEKYKKGDGTGLNNLKKRLELFDKRCQFNIGQYSENTVKAQIIIHSNEGINS